MARKLDDATIDSWLSAHAGWARVNQKSLAKEYKFPDFGSALGFVVRLGCAAEKKDHHPDVELGWGRARVTWSTHDAGGITDLDLEMADTTERLAK